MSPDFKNILNRQGRQERQAIGSKCFAFLASLASLAVPNHIHFVRGSKKEHGRRQGQRIQQSCSPDGAKRNPGINTIPRVALHAGYALNPEL
jgi:hypothetical protein